jgi:hypothetical protein
MGFRRSPEYVGQRALADRRSSCHAASGLAGTESLRQQQASAFAYFDVFLMFTVVTPGPAFQWAGLIWHDGL